MNTFTNLRKKFEQAVKMNKRKFYWNKFKNCIGDSTRQTYKLLNELNGKSISRLKVPILESCQKLNDNPTEKDVANRFNDFFINIGENLKTDISNVTPPPVPKLNWSMFLYRTTPSEINDIICQLDNKSTSGDDYINNQIVKASKNVTSPFLSFLVNLSFEKGIFPSALRKAKVIPVHKNNSRLDENYYRPISLLIV